ncbi:MAG: hypothetical protein Q7S59_04315 [Sulfurimonas sp.]|nr:hypothetical protein [Sulfurimonas sp.]
MRFIFLLLLITSLFAENHKSHNEHHIYKELSHLDLSTDQNMELKIILKEFRTQLKEFKDLEKEIEEKRKELFLLDSFKVNEVDALNHLLDDKAHGIENNFLNKIHLILTIEQRKKFMDYFDDWKVK